MSSYPIVNVVQGGSEIAVLPFPGAKRPALSLDLVNARRLIRELDAVLAQHDRARLEREAALMGSLRRLVADAASDYRGKHLMPHEVPRSVWLAATLPLRWILAKGDAPTPPKALEALVQMFVGDAKVAQVLRTDLARHFRLVGTHYVAAGELDLRHERYVASAIETGMQIPHAVGGEYPAAFWRASDLPWIEYYIDPASWATALLGRRGDDRDARKLHELSVMFNKPRAGESHLASLHRMTRAGLDLMLDRRAA